MEVYLNLVLTWLAQYSLQLSLTLALLILFIIIQRLVIPRLAIYVEQSELQDNALYKAIYVFRLLYGVITLALLLFIWGFDFKWLLAASTGIIALTGVALFASWSILSNITAFFILVIHKSYKRGNFIRVIELDNYIEGFICEINLFNTRLLSENREYIIYPNNLLIARPTIINPKKRFTTVGKIQEFLNQQSLSETPKAGG